MRVRIEIGLDFNGNHALNWYPSDDPGAVDVAKSTLERWSNEREAFTVAFLRWKLVMEEVDETLYRSERARIDRSRARVHTPAATGQAAASKAATGHAAASHAATGQAAASHAATSQAAASHAAASHAATSHAAASHAAASHAATSHAAASRAAAPRPGASVPKSEVVAATSSAPRATRQHSR